MMGEGETGGLPPGPWRVVRGDFGRVRSVEDATGDDVIVPSSLRGELFASPAVLRAVEALPTLVAAAREVYGRFLVDREFIRYQSVHALLTLGDALDAIDGKGGADDGSQM